MSFCKYLGINIPILMYDGKVKMSQDIKIGDEIMGDDSIPRKVLLTYTGEIMKLFRIIPRYSKSFVVGEYHDLLVTNQDNKTMVVNVKNFPLVQNKNSYRINNIFVNYPTKFVPIPPYVYGLLIANNKIRKNIASIKIENENIKNYVINTLSNLQINFINDEETKYIHIIDQLLLNIINTININETKIIPEYYVKNDTIILSEFLAGIIDMAGGVDMLKNCYILENIDDKIVNDLVKICNTLGFFCLIYKSVKNYKNIHIYGNYITDLPILSSKTLSKNNVINDFRMAEIQDKKYIAIKIDGRFICLEDSTII